MLVLPIAYSTIEQGTWQQILTSASMWEDCWYNSSNTDQDALLFRVYLNAGTYTVRLLYWRRGEGGILDLKLDGTEIASFDLSGTSTVDVTQEQTGVVVSTSGWKTLKAIVDGSSGSGHQARIQAIYFIPTST